MLNIIRALCVILFVAVLTACGGGGGGSSPSAAMPTSPPSPVLPPVPEFSLGGTEAVANVAGQVSRAAQSAPRAGSATQSSGANDAINVAVRAHSNEALTAVVGGATLVAAHRPDDNNVRVWLTNNDAGGKLATLGVSVNPFCPGENFINVNGSVTHGLSSAEICRRYADSPVLAAPTNADGSFAVIATTGQTPVVIDGRTVAINYRTATVTSSRFRSANMFSRTDDGGLLYARVYSDAVLSPSAPRTVLFQEIGVVTIHNRGGELLVQDGNVDRFTTLSPPTPPSLTIYSNRINDPDKAVTIASPAPGGAVSTPVILRESERIVSATLTGPGNGDNYRRNYLSGGFWLHAPANAESITDYEFGVFAGGSDELSARMIPPLAGVAVYRGEAAGVYASSQRGREEVSSFRANAVLTASFSGSVHGSEVLGVRVSGRVDGFVLANGATLQNAAIDLGAAERANAETGLFSGDTGGGRFSGKWGGNFYGAPGRWNGNFYEDVPDGHQPDAIAATFGGTSGDNLESVAGFVGARRMSVVAVNASFAPYSAPPLFVDSGDIWHWRDSDYEDGRFFAAHDGGGRLRHAGMRLGALEFRHSQYSAPSALTGGEDILPFFAANGGSDMQMRYNFGGGFSGFAAHSDSYRQGGFLFSHDIGRFGIRSSFSRINENGTLLGGKWGGIAPLLDGGDSLQTRAKMSFAAGDSWTLFAAAEHSRTKARIGGIVGRIDNLRAFGWNAGAEADNLFRHGDRLRLALTGETAISGGSAILHLRQSTPGGWRIVERAVPLASGKRHHTIAAGYGLALSDKERWSFAAAYRISGEARAHLQWRAEL